MNNLQTKSNNMNKNLKISGSIAINANAGKVWDVLTNPDKIKNLHWPGNIDRLES